MNNVSGSDHEVLVWYADLSQLPEFDHNLFLDILDDSEVVINNNYLIAEKRREHAISHLLRRIMLSDILKLNASKIEFQYTKYGKPILKYRNIDLDFNITHTDRAVACILSRIGKVGIDMESNESVKNIELMSRNCLTTKEQSFIYRSDNLESNFIKLWTLKEAYLKAIGKGLYIYPQQIEFDPITILVGNPKFMSNQNILLDEWYFKLFQPISNMVMAVCSNVCLKNNIEIVNITTHFKKLCKEAN